MGGALELTWLEIGRERAPTCSSSTQPADSQAAAPHATLTAPLVVSGAAGGMVAPALEFLYSLQQRSLLDE